jgi:DNA invertase Pin-like site-specific DNA recombinase
MTKSQGKRVSKRVAIYLRVSTAEQTTTNQRRELHAVAKRHGWSVVRVFEDAGISGAKGRKDRPALDALLRSVARREVDMVAAWSVDRLGRSLTDLLDFLRELHAKGGLRRVRKGHDPRASPLWACPSERAGDQLRASAA